MAILRAVGGQSGIELGRDEFVTPFDFATVRPLQTFPKNVMDGVLNLL